MRILYIKPYEKELRPENRREDSKRHDRIITTFNRQGHFTRQLTGLLYDSSSDQDDVTDALEQMDYHILVTASLPIDKNSPYTRVEDWMTEITAEDPSYNRSFSRISTIHSRFPNIPIIAYLRPIPLCHATNNSLKRNKVSRVVRASQDISQDAQDLLALLGRFQPQAR